MSQANADTRYHALDGLRGAMMLLGIYLHVAVAYSPIGGWAFKQPELTHALDGTIGVIHIFRMPLFYVMAGFFSALLLERYGLRRATANRAMRILLPFVVGWLILFPLVSLLAGSGRFGLQRAWDGLISGRFLQYAHPMHLWFLEYLLVLYLLALVAVPAIAMLPAGLRATLSRWFRAGVASWWAPALFAVPSFLALLSMKFAALEDPPSFVPATRIVVAYAIPFAFGWLLYRNVDLLDGLRRRAWAHTGLALAMSLLYVGFMLGLPLDPDVRFLASRAVNALALWSFILGLTGLFLRYLDQANPRVRYLCDSSYFLYLAHMPVVIVFQLLLLPLPWPPLAKVPVVLAATIAVLLVLYHYAVRPTLIGAVLNGRRCPIGRPAMAPAAA